MVLPAKLIKLETTFDQEADPQYRCTITIKDPAIADPLTFTAGCSGTLEDCPEDIALENGYTLVEA